MVSLSFWGGGGLEGKLFNTGLKLPFPCDSFNIVCTPVSSLELETHGRSAQPPPWSLYQPPTPPSGP